MKNQEKSKRRDLFKLLGVTFLAGLITKKGYSQQVEPSTSQSKVHIEQEQKSKGFNFQNISNRIANLKNRAFSTSNIVSSDVELERTESEKKVQEEIYKTTTNKIKVIERVVSDKTLPLELNRIEKNFSFQSKSTDINFQFQHVEILLDQALLLIKRCLRDRANYEALAIKSFKQNLEISEYLEFDKIRNEENLNGVHDVEYKVSSSLYDSENLIQEYRKEQKTILENIINNNFNKDKVQKILNSYKKNAFLSGTPSYYMENQTFSSYQKIEYDKKNLDVREHFRNSAEEINSHRLTHQVDLLNLQTSSIDREIKSKEQKLKGMMAKKKWDELNSNYSKRKLRVRRHHKDIQVASISAPDGILNYSKRLESIQARFISDFREAIARLKVIEKGIDLIYGYKEPLPRDSKSITYYDDVHAYAIKANNYLARFTRAEQSIIYTISLRQLLGEEAFKSQVKTNTVNFELKDSLFPSSFKHVRLRGTSIYVESNKECNTAIYQLSLYHPKTSKIKHLDDTIHSIDQTNLNEVYFGRVFSRKFVKDGDVMGISNWLNLSPFGRWKINLLNTIGEAKRTKIEDVQIDFHTAYINK